MSHISKIELVIHSLEDLKDACRQLGFEFIKNQKTFKWYGRWVGDTPLPEGVKIEDIGKCDHAIRVPGCEYEVGVIKRGDHYILLWDYYSAGVLNKRSDLMPVNSNRPIPLQESEKRPAEKDIEC